MSSFVALEKLHRKRFALVLISAFSRPMFLASIFASIPLGTIAGWPTPFEDTADSRPSLRILVENLQKFTDITQAMTKGLPSLETYAQCQVDRVRVKLPYLRQDLTADDGRKLPSCENPSHDMSDYGKGDAEKFLQTVYADMERLTDTVLAVVSLKQAVTGSPRGSTNRDTAVKTDELTNIVREFPHHSL